MYCVDMFPKIMLQGVPCMLRHGQGWGGMLTFLWTCARPDGKETLDAIALFSTISSSLQSSLMELKTQRMQRQEKRHEKASGPGASRPFSRVFHYKPSIFGGIPHVWNPSSPLGRSDDSFRKRSGSSEVEAVEAGWFISWKLHLLKGPGHGKMEVPSEFF